MPTANHDGIRIHYEVEGAGQPLVLQHWSLATLEDWRETGFVDLLRKDYQLILIDARGHGGSDKPHDPVAYGLRERVGDVVAVLDDLAIDRAHFFGYSMGGWIGFGIAKYAAERFGSLVIGGQHAYAQSLEPLRRLASIGIEDGYAGFISHWEENYGPLSEKRKARTRAFDFEALRAVAHDRDDLSDVLPSVATPCLVLAGEEDAVFDRAKACAAMMPRATFVSLPDLDHGGFLDRPDLVVPHVGQFLSSIAET